MAKEDLDAMVVVKTDDPKNAADQLVGYGESANDVENAQKAKDANVQHAGFIGYDEALSRYAARPDMEDLAHKNARDMPAEFSDQDFMRAIDADAQDHGTATGGTGSGSGA
jgi:hypothetical protein